MTYITWVAIFGYLLGSWQQRRALFNQPRDQHSKPTWLGTIAWCTHGLSLYLMLAQTGPTLTFGTSTSIAAWFVVGIVLYSSLRKPTSSLLIVILPLAASCLALSLINTHDLATPAAPSNSLVLFIHILLSFSAYALLAIAALIAVMVAYLNNMLKAHQPSTLLRALPPLQAMESLLFETLAIGLFLLTLSLGSGFIFLDDMLAQKVAHKTVLSICAWFVFAGLLIGHYRLGWRGRIAVRWTLTGFGFLMVAYFGSKFVINYLL